VASITLKSLPPALHRALKSRAARHKRSLNKEVIAVLEATVVPERKIDVEAMIEKARKFRASLKFVTTPEEIDRYKREGRE
jgi:plasmid stability protein